MKKPLDRRKTAAGSEADLYTAERTFKKRWSLLTMVLLICIAELAAGTAANINKYIHFKSKIKNLENKLDEEKARNEQLTLQIKNFDSQAVLESITRNSLKMAGRDEVLILIHKPKEY